jgi:hypothetical protein
MMEKLGIGPLEKNVPLDDSSRPMFYPTDQVARLFRRIELLIIQLPILSPSVMVVKRFGKMEKGAEEAIG